MRSTRSTGGSRGHFFALASGAAASLLSLWAASPSLAAPAPEPVAAPVAKKVPVVDVYHGQKVTDDYRWLENAQDPEVRAWSDGQNAHARDVLDHLPSSAGVRARVAEVESASSVDRRHVVYRGGRLFALKYEPPKQQPFLVSLFSADDASSERVVVDPNKMDEKGRTSIDFFSPSVDGKLVAVSLSANGSEEGTLKVFETATGKARLDVIPGVNYGTAGGSVAWNEDSSGFYYTRYPRGKERPPEDLHFYQQVYFHKLGDAPEADRFSLGKDFPRIAEIELSSGESGRYVLASVANGDGGEFAHFLLAPGQQEWDQVSYFVDKVTKAKLGSDNSLYLLSRKEAPRGKLLRLPADKPKLSQATVAVEESLAVIEDFAPSSTRLFVVDLLGGPSQIRVIDHQGKEVEKLPILPVSSVKELIHLEGPDMLFRNESYLEPPAWYRYTGRDHQVEKTALFGTSPVSFKDTEVVREFAKSKDGTAVPINILRLKKTGAVKNHKASVLLTGYGGYGISLSPNFDPGRKVWLEQGGIFAIANLRGGGEFGDEWHDLGRLNRKQNVFDDFTSCAKYLVAQGYTRKEKLAVMGGSNGGLLMGAFLTQHPNLAGAVVSWVGLYDMLRVELSPNGAFNVTEFGSVKGPESWKALYAYSPYHRVKDGASYPPVLFLTGANDPRVDPYHSRKMTARLQAASSSQEAVLLRTSDSSGHGVGTALNERIAQKGDIYAFLFGELGLDWKPVKKLSADDAN